MAQKAVFTLLRSSGQEAVIRADFPDYTVTDILVDGATMSKLSMNDAFPVLEAGAPELLTSAVSLIVPENAVPTVEILESDFDIVRDFVLAPSKGSLKRDVNPDDVPYTRGVAYSSDSLFGNDRVDVGSPYRLRDYCGVAFKFYPFAYNPVQKLLKAYRSIVVRVQYNGTLTRQPAAKSNRAFDAVYRSRFLNYEPVRAAGTMENGDILVVSPDEFCSAMQPYADWKTRAGYHTEIVPLSVAGNTPTAIKSYIQDYYDTHNLGFVVIVGDNGYFPVLTEGGQASDNCYVNLAGDDWYPDAFLGKISAETVGQVATQVRRFVEYERNPPETSHFPVFCGISSKQGPGYNNLKDFEHIRHLGNILAGYTYESPGFEIFDGSQGGQDAPGDATATQVTEALNAGVGIVNYCGHGSDTYWVSSGFSNANVDNLTNRNKLPVIISVACLNGNYVNRTCFAESWLRATCDGSPTGAASVLMSTISQSWQQPMCAQEEMVKCLTGSDGRSKLNTFGAVTCNGICKMLDNYNDYEDARTWVLFGDPALCVRTAVPETLSLQCPETLLYGTSSVTVSSPDNGASAVLSCRGQMLDKDTVENGSVTFQIPLTTEAGDTLNVTCTFLNRLPAEGNIVLIPSSGPYVVCRSVSLTDNGNHDGLADCGETLAIAPLLKNVGSGDAHSIVVKCRINDPYVTLIDSVLTVSSLAASASESFPAAFSVRLADNVPARHQLHLNMHVTCAGSHVFDSHVMLPAYAPTPAIGGLTVDDAAGNRNGRLDSAETADIVIRLSNAGNGTAPEGTFYIDNPEGALHLSQTEVAVPQLEPGATFNAVIRTAVDASLDMPAHTFLPAAYVTGNYTANSNILVRIGSIADDFETGNFSALPWDNSSTWPWIVTSVNACDGIFAARSGLISASQSSTLQFSQTTAASDSLTFYVYVSSEIYDYLKFYIDNDLMNSWSGEMPWTKVSYLVGPGHHTYRWTYEKDDYVNEGSDMCMIDNVFFPSLRNGGVGMKDAAAASGAVVMPNPAADHVDIVMPACRVTAGTRCIVYGMEGRQLLDVPISSSMSTVSLSGLAKGVYVFRIMDNNAVVETFKVVKN